MPEVLSTRTSLLNKGLVAVLVAQFFSALADNALLFAAIALLKTMGAPGWQTPVLQEFFVGAFILLAPFVGPFSDAYPKGRVMLVANGLKLTGAAAMLAGLHPLLAYGLVGMGAAAYSPAKYGILSDLAKPEQLVKANSLMEGSTIVAILVGAVTGGLLADWSAYGALALVAGCYGVAALANLFIPKLSPTRSQPVSARQALGSFIVAFKTLLTDKDARFSLLGTSVFWGTGSTLRLLLIAWVPAVLHVTDNSTAANLSGMVAIGIAIGAVVAAKFITLPTINRVLPAGISIGVLVLLFGQASSMAQAALVLVLVGAMGGLYVVPLNALLQERGHASVGAGQAVAVQNFFENGSMLLMVGLYAELSKAGMPTTQSIAFFGALVLSVTLALSALRVRSTK
jgi:MFS transporter, LPLT family, lysophospholipid transporter